MAKIPKTGTEIEFSVSVDEHLTVNAGEAKITRHIYGVELAWNQVVFLDFPEAKQIVADLLDAGIILPAGRYVSRPTEYRDGRPEPPAPGAEKLKVYQVATWWIPQAITTQLIRAEHRRKATGQKSSPDRYVSARQRKRLEAIRKSRHEGEDQA